ncbi:uncharacterized protein ACIGJ3_016879 isoform 1-T2 [Trichechus inunguis]
MLSKAALAKPRNRCGRGTHKGVTAKKHGSFKVRVYLKDYKLRYGIEGEEWLWKEEIITSASVLNKYHYVCCFWNQIDQGSNSLFCHSPKGVSVNHGDPDTEMLAKSWNREGMKPSPEEKLSGMAG